MSLYDAIINKPGYTTELHLNDRELTQVRNCVTADYLRNLEEISPGLVDEARDLGIENYHHLAIDFDHATAWPKNRRLLAPSVVRDLATMEFYQALEGAFGPIDVWADQLNWRLVRPNAAGDIGSIHADRWFWDIGYGEMPEEGLDRFKIWIPLHAEPGRNGLSVKPDSHQREWKYHVEEKLGMSKPVIDEDPEALEMCNLPLRSGQMVAFHDSLLHGGVFNRGETCRVSLELTILFRPEVARARGAAAA